MRYRGTRDRQVSLYVAALIIVLAGSAMTLVIVRSISAIDFEALAATSA